MDNIFSWFPKTFSLNYHPDLFTTWIEVLHGIKSKTLTLFLLFIIIVIPFFILTVSSVLLLVFIKRQFNKSRKLTLQTKKIDKKNQKVTISIVVKVFGFSITTIPFLVRVVLGSFTNIVFCRTDDSTLAITFYIFFSRSLVNVLVYIAIEQNFRNFVFGNKKKENLNTISNKCFNKQTTESSNVVASIEDKNKTVELQKTKTNQAFENK